MYSTTGTAWSMHEHTYMGDYKTGNLIAVFGKYNFALREVHEILSPEPICPDQKVSTWTGPDDRPLYEFAQLWRLLSHGMQWALYRYRCDSTIEETASQTIVARFWTIWYYKFDVYGSGSDSDKIIGTIEQGIQHTFLIFTLFKYYNAWIRAGEDLALFAATVMIVDYDSTSMDYQTQQNANS